MSGPAPTYVPFELVSSFEFASGVAMGVLTGLGYIALGAISEALRGASVTHMSHAGPHLRF